MKSYFFQFPTTSIKFYVTFSTTKNRHLLFDISEALMISSPFLLLLCKIWFQLWLNIWFMTKIESVNRWKNPYLKNLILLLFTILWWRSCYSCSWHLSPFEKFLFLFVWSSSQTEVAVIIAPSIQSEVFIFVHFTFVACRSCYSRTIQFPLKQKLLLLLIASFFHAKVVILLHFTLLSCRKCYSR